MQAKLACWIVLWFLCLGMNVSAEYRWGDAHLHTNCSDGTRLAAQVVGKTLDRGGAFTILLDHFANLTSGNATVDAAAMKVYAAVAKSEKDIVICGSEFGAHHGKPLSHLGIFRLQPVEGDSELRRLNNQEGAGQALIDRAHALGYLVVALHPNKKSKTSDYTFDWSHAKGIDGIELGNEADKSSRAKSIGQYHDFLKRGILLFVWYGNDSHTPADPADEQRWEGLTGVDAAVPLTAESLVAAFRQGRTYASFDGIKIVSLNYRIGFEAQSIASRPDFRFDLAVAAGEWPPVVEVFRDGVSIGKAVGYRTPTAQVRYRFRDTGDNVAGGQHLYTLEIADRLVTSPIVLNVPAEHLLEPAIDGYQVRDRDGHNPGERVFSLIMKHEEAPSLTELLADAGRFKGLAASAFQNLLEIRQVSDKFAEVDQLSGCYTCGDLYTDADAKMCDVQIGRRDADGRHQCGTFQMVLQDDRWRIRAARVGYVNRIGLRPAKVKK